jgi:hypothetical protein
MKKVFALFAIVGLLVTASSCGNKEVSEETTEEVEVVIEETEEVETEEVETEEVETEVATEETAG